MVGLIVSWGLVALSGTPTSFVGAASFAILSQEQVQSRPGVVVTCVVPVAPFGAVAIAMRTLGAWGLTANRQAAHPAGPA
jgi:MFS-type transporter involved in bile tolerance (Atg22 family)